MIEDELIPRRWKIGIALSGHKKQKPSPTFIPFSLVPVAQETAAMSQVSMRLSRCHKRMSLKKWYLAWHVCCRRATRPWVWYSNRQWGSMILTVMSTNPCESCHSKILWGLSVQQVSAAGFIATRTRTLKNRQLFGKAQRTYLGIGKSREDGRKCLPHIFTIPAHLIHHQGWKPQHGGIKRWTLVLTPQNHWGSIFNTSSKVRCLNHWTTKKRRKGGCLLHEFGCKRWVVVQTDGIIVWTKDKTFTTIVLKRFIKIIHISHIHQIQSESDWKWQVANGSALRKCCQSHGIGGCYPRQRWHIAMAHCLRQLLGH